jgi:hypothetical protein
MPASLSFHPDGFIDSPWFCTLYLYRFSTSLMISVFIWLPPVLNFLSTVSIYANHSETGDLCRILDCKRGKLLFYDILVSSIFTVLRFTSKRFLQAMNISIDRIPSPLFWQITITMPASNGTISIITINIDM